MVLAILSIFIAMITMGWMFGDTTSWTISLIGMAIQAIVYIVMLYALNIYKIIWYYSSLQEMLKLIVAVLFSQMVSFVIHLSCSIGMIKGSWKFSDEFLKVHLLAGAFMVVFVIIFRSVIYTIERREASGTVKSDTEEEINTMVIGAGEACNYFVREMQLKHSDEYDIKCIIDDNPTKHKMLFEGVPIVGNRYSIEENVKKYNIKKIIFAIPSCPMADRKEIFEICTKTGCVVKTMPSIYQMVENTDKVEYVKQIRDVGIEDLLGRDPIRIDLDCVMNYVSGKVVMVTGGGGSIGSELCRQIAAYNPKKLIIFDIYENNAYDIQLELKKKYPMLDLVTLIGSVRDNQRLDMVFEKYRPEVVYHAAAHKHVPLMEDSPNEAIKNNVFGTLNTVQMADKFRVKRFVLISTDKAVNPTNIMGASKRICEMIVQAFNRVSETEFVAVRFGNVLGSNGSVVPLFKTQIQAGGPVTVTHPDIIRYFMTIPEAVSLVLQAGADAKGGEIFVLDMGKPVKILDLAENLIRLSGFEPYKEIDIQFTGLRPGEKLYEELLMSEEGLKATANKLIHIGKPLEFDEEHFYWVLHKMKHSMCDDSVDMRSLVKEIVPTYIITPNQ
ncbi:MAG: polysaccharide biosynthesis protein [Clostridia bacterium]|nr:polysaccharide biosynthesis protein [Clostridia bacterium]